MTARHSYEGCAIATVDPAARVRRPATSWSTATGSPPSARAAGPEAPGARRIDGARLPRHARASSTATTTSTSGPRAAWPSRRRCSSGWSSSTPSGRGSTARSRTPPPAPGWRRSRARAAARRPTTTTCSRAGAGDLLEIEIEAARDIGMRFHPCRGSMDLGRSHGGLPPDEVVEDRDAILAASEAAIDRFHDPSPGSMLRIALAPCSPFSVTRELMRDDRGARAPARRAAAHAPGRDAGRGGVLPRAVRRAPGRVPRGRSAGSATTSGSRTACTSTTTRSGRFGETGTGVAHCPTLQRAARRRHRAGRPALLQAGAPVGLGVDGAASNEAGELGRRGAPGAALASASRTARTR